MKKDNTSQEKTIKDLDYDYVIDDSRMPSPEEVAAFPSTPDIDRALDLRIKQALKEAGLDC